MIARDNSIRVIAKTRQSFFYLNMENSKSWNLQNRKEFQFLKKWNKQSALEEEY